MDEAKVNFIAPLLNKMHTDPQFSFWLLALLCKYIPKNTSQQKLETGNLRSVLLQVNRYCSKNTKYTVLLNIVILYIETYH